MRDEQQRSAQFVFVGATLGSPGRGKPRPYESCGASLAEHLGEARHA